MQPRSLAKTILLSLLNLGLTPFEVVASLASIFGPSGVSRSGPGHGHGGVVNVASLEWQLEYTPLGCGPGAHYPAGSPRARWVVSVHLNLKPSLLVTTE